MRLVSFISSLSVALVATVLTVWLDSFVSPPALMGFHGNRLGVAAVVAIWAAAVTGLLLPPRVAARLQDSLYSDHPSILVVALVIGISLLPGVVLLLVRLLKPGAAFEMRVGAFIVSMLVGVLAYPSQRTKLPGLADKLQYWGFAAGLPQFLLWVLAVD